MNRIAIIVVMLLASPLTEEVSAEAKVLKDCNECPKLTRIPAGEIDIRLPPGALGRGHNVGYYSRVTFSQPFAIGLYEVTNAEWLACVKSDACDSLEVDATQILQNPVTQVSWQQAVGYTKWLSKKTGQIYRLPSNTEWEYAARSELGMNRYFNLKPADVCAYGNVYDLSAENELEYGLDTLPCEDKTITLTTVGNFLPNSFGIYDTIGNVFEWTEDCPNPGGQGRGGFPTTGRAWIAGDCSLRGYRGSSWLSNEPSYLTEATRFKDLTSSEEDLGFRVVRELP